MLKTRMLFRLGAGLVVMLFIFWAVIIVWPQSPPKASDIEKRGLKSPPGLKLPATSASSSDKERASIGTPRDWLDQGLDSLAGWNDNPLGIHRTSFGQHLSELQHSKDPKDQEEYQRLLALGKKWRDNLLTRYPELKVQYRDVPDDKNALKRLFDLQKRLIKDDGSSALRLPDDLQQQLANKKPWDAKAAQAWVDANRATLDELRAISQMPESSIKDCSEAYYSFNEVNSLLMDARLSAERGDFAASLESLRAVRGLAAILQGTEAPPLFHQLFGAAMQRHLRDCVFESIMPAIPASEMDLAAWENLLKPEVQTPADFSLTMKGDWNFGMQYHLLPALADPAETQSPHDAEALVEARTNFTSEIVRQNEGLALTDLPTSADLSFDPGSLSWRSRRLAGEEFGYHYRDGWLRHQLQAGLTQAAFAILKGQPVPNDPIYGKPYTWNPETRQLGLPKRPEFRKMSSRPLTLPKLR